MLAKLLRSLFGATITKSGKDAGPAKPLRGSGSWDMSYEGGQELQPLPKSAPPKSAPPKTVAKTEPAPVAMPEAAVENAAKPKAAASSVATFPEPLSPASPPPRVAVHAVRLMEPSDLALYQSLCDRIEAEVPDMTLHAQVALSAFLRVDRRGPEDARQAMAKSFAEERVAFLFVDGSGQPVLAMDRAGPGLDAKRAILDEAGLSLMDIPEVAVDRLWSEVLEQLDVDENDRM